MRNELPARKGPARRAPAAATSVRHIGLDSRSTREGVRTVNVEKVVFGFVVLLAATLNFGTPEVPVGSVGPVVA